MSKTVWPGSTLLNPVPVVLVSCGTLEQPNAITVAWAGTVASTPPAIGISIKPERFSHDLIANSGEFVVNLPNQSLVRAVDKCGVLSGRTVDKFREFGLTAEKASQLSVPLIAECPINLECRVKQIVPLGSHDLFIGEVVASQVEESLLDENGRLDLGRAKLIAYSHGAYLSLGKKLGSFGYSVRKKTAKKWEEGPRKKNRK